MTEPLALPTTRDAFELLSKPTLQLSEEDIVAICADLRKRRERFLQGIADKPARKPPADNLDRSPEAKAARTASLENELGNLL